jgi:hypothetical protein
MLLGGRRRFSDAGILRSLRAAKRQRVSTRIFALVTGRLATRNNSGLPFSLQELLPDDGCNVVVHGDAEDVTVLTDDPVIARGISGDHITRSGHAVLGFAYCRFADGVTLFYPRSHSLCVEENEPV